MMASIILQFESLCCSDHFDILEAPLVCYTELYRDPMDPAGIGIRKDINRLELGLVLARTWSIGLASGQTSGLDSILRSEIL